MTHGPFEEGYFASDPNFDSRKLAILEVSEDAHRYPQDFEVIRMRDLEGFTGLGKNYAESEAIWNLWKSGLAADLEFIGFTQYDKPFRFHRIKTRLSQGRSLFRAIEHEISISLNKPLHLSFEAHRVRGDYRQKIIADPSVSDRLTGSGINCYDKILEDYNEFHGTKFDLDSVFAKQTISLCSSFLVDQDSFQRLMTFWNFIIEKGEIDRLDPMRKWRLQGGLAERYFGVFLALEPQTLIDFSTPHINLKGK